MSYRPVRVEKERERLGKRPLSYQEEQDAVRKYNYDTRDIIKHEDEINKILIDME